MAHGYATDTSAGSTAEQTRRTAPERAHGRNASARSVGTGRRPPAADRPVLGVMSTPVVAISAGRSLGEALQVLAAAGLRHLVVLDADRRYVGMLSDRTVTAAWATDPTLLTRWRAIDAAEPAPAVVGTKVTLGQVARLMREYRVDAIAVIRPDGLPLGIVTATDLVSALAVE